MTSGDPVLESLKALAPELARRDSPALAASFAPSIARLGEGLAPAEVKAAVDSVSAACRALYLHARSGEGLAIAQALLDSCERAGDRAQARRAAGICGLLCADIGDLVGSIEYQVRVLRSAAEEEDRAEMARAWCNMGVAFGTSGRNELAARSYERALGLVQPVVRFSHTRFACHNNLALICEQQGEVEEGLRHGESALGELQGLDKRDAYDEILLRRNLSRLLLAAGRIDEAEEHVAHALVLAEAAKTPRAGIAADITRAAHDLAVGRADLALTRLDRALARARQVPAALHDALACAVRAEEAAGYPARALLRLQELSEHLYGHAVERTRQAVARAGIEGSDIAARARHAHLRDRLAAMLEPPAPPRNWALLRRLAASAALRMDDSGLHGVRVGALVKGLALRHGVAALQALEMGLAAELHDIGMSSVPPAVLGRKGALNEAELALVRRHAEAGAEMLVQDAHPRLLLAREIAAYHHARWDGRGHPAGVAGEAIPLAARMCAIADAYDFMVCGLAGRAPVSMEAALAELQAGSGGQFDPELVSCFTTLVNDELEGLPESHSGHGMDAFEELVASLKANRGFV